MKKIMNEDGLDQNTKEKQALELERFLQFHVRKTAGIPGLLPLFIGKKARVTEKLARGTDDSGRGRVGEECCRRCSPARSGRGCWR